MHSVRTKLIALISVVVMLIYSLLAGISIYYIRSSVESNARDMLTMLAQEKSQELDLQFEEAERAVSSLEEYIRATANPEKLKADESAMRDYMDDLAVHAYDAAKIAGNVATVWFKADPDIYGKTTGVFYVDNGNDGFIRIPGSDISMYEKDDMEHAGWYYGPKENGRAMWTDPYYNMNINVYMISYASPIVINGEFFGVVGMDETMSGIHSVIDTIDFAAGSGFLMSPNGNLIYHKEYPEGLKKILFGEEMSQVSECITLGKATRHEIGKCKWNGIENWVVGAPLKNGMILAILAPEGEIMNPMTHMLRNMISVLAVMFIALLFIVWRVVVWIVKPIQELTVASSRISKGELNVAIDYHSKDEVGKLADELRMVAKEMREYISYIHTQAYTDALSGVGNKTAYLDMVKTIDRKIQEGLADFAVAIFDINGLKHINDTQGHEYGDLVIIDMSTVLKASFGADKVYRIGGDEFIAIMENVIEDDIQGFMNKYELEIKKINEIPHAYEAKLAAAKGYTIYNSSVHKDFKAVFQSADTAMYEDKGNFYRGRNNRRKY